MTRVKQVVQNLDRIRQVGLCIAMLATLVAFFWTALAEPRIENRITVRLHPIEDAMAFQVFLTMETLDSATVARATAKYKQFKAQAKGDF